MYILNFLTGSNVRTGVGSNFGGAYSYSLSSYCQPGCANSWLADKFCDQVAESNRSLAISIINDDSLHQKCDKSFLFL